MKTFLSNVTIYKNKSYIYISNNEKHKDMEITTKGFKVFFQTETTEENFFFETLKEARAKIKAIHTNEDHRFIILLSLWEVLEEDGFEFEEGKNTKFAINRLDIER